MQVLNRHILAPYSAFIKCLGPNFQTSVVSSVNESGPNHRLHLLIKPASKIVIVWLGKLLMASC